jgi:hypothetical protein
MHLTPGRQQVQQCSFVALSRYGTQRTDTCEGQRLTGAPRPPHSALLSSFRTPRTLQEAVPAISAKPIQGVAGVTHTFFSYAENYSPPSPGSLWTRHPGTVNADAAAKGPDAAALVAALWGTANAVTRARVVGSTVVKTDCSPIARDCLLARAAAIVQSVFTGPKAMPPTLEYARVIPTTGLDAWKRNNEGFEALNDIALVLMDNTTLPLPDADAGKLLGWAQ